MVNNTTSTIKPYGLTLSGLSRAYDGSLAILAQDILPDGGLSGLNGQKLSLTGQGSITNANASQTPYALALGGLSLEDGTGLSSPGMAANYTLVPSAVIYANSSIQTIEQSAAALGHQVTVSPVAISISIEDIVKTYDAGTSVSSPVVKVVSGQLFSNASNGNTLDAIDSTNAAYAFTTPDVHRNAQGHVLSTKEIAITALSNLNAPFVMLDGNNNANYTITVVNNTTSTIKPLGLTLDGTSRNYDGTARVNAEDLIPLGGIIGLGDQRLSLTGQGSLDNKNVELDGDGNPVAKSLSLGSLALANGSAGGLANNYSLNLSGVIYANTTLQNDLNRSINEPSVPHQVTLTPLGVTPSGLSKSKIFDGNTNAARISSISISEQLVNPLDRVTIQFGQANFDDPRVGSNKNVTLSGLVIAGPDAINYWIPSFIITLGDILPVPVEPLKQTNESRSFANPSVTEIKESVPVSQIKTTTLSVPASQSTNSIRIAQSNSLGVSLQSEGANIALEDVKELPLPVFVAKDKTPIELSEVVQLDVAKTNAKVSSSDKQMEPIDVKNLDGMAVLASTQIQLGQEDGTELNVEIKVTENNLLVLDLGETPSDIPDQELTLLGIASLKEMGISPRTLKGVVIQRATSRS